MPTLSDGHLWLHFTAAEAWLGDDPRIRVLDRGAGCYLWDIGGQRYLDGLSALFCVQVGYGRTEITRAAAAQMDRLPFATNWGVAHQPAIDLAVALSERFPGDSPTPSSSTQALRRWRPPSSWRASTTRPAASRSASR